MSRAAAQGPLPTLPSPAGRLRPVARRLCPDFLRGVVDYVRSDRTDRSRAPFNGQPLRLRLFSRIRRAVPFRWVVETGTWFGTTTRHLRRSTGLPVWSVEVDARHFGHAWAALAGIPGIRLARKDSRDFLRDLLARRRFRDQPGFLYLDAHWRSDLPLVGELELIFERCARPVVMIDDFEVPGDPGYGHDDYGPGKELTIELLADFLRRHDPAVFFPSAPSSLEGGARRGCVVLARRGEDERRLTSVPGLVPFEGVPCAPS